MKRVCPLALIMFSVLVGALIVNVVVANPGPVTQIPPVVRMNEMQVYASISQINGELWAKVDSEYQMKTIHAFGDSFLTENWGMGLLVDPSPYVIVTVAYDRLDAQYPVPSNATNISVKMDATNLEYALTERTYHLFDNNLPELHWHLSPVPSNFSISVHYEHPVSTLDQTYSYLGEYAFVIPFGARYGLQEIIDYSFNEYPWFGNSTTAQMRLKLDSAFANMSVYAVDGFGALHPLNCTLANGDGLEIMDLIVSGESPIFSETTLPYGVVVVFDEPSENSEPFPTLLVASVIIVTIVLFAVFLLMTKHKH